MQPPEGESERSLEPRGPQDWSLVALGAGTVGFAGRWLSQAEQADEFA